MEKEILKPGKYDDISLQEYHHKYGGWSKSRLDNVAKSWAHYLESLNSPKSTDAMDFGSAFHCRILTPELFDRDFALLPDCDRRTKAGKAVYTEFMESAGDKVAIKKNRLDDIDRMRDAIMAHPVAGPLLSNGEAEQTFAWTDPATGLPCKARPDYLRHDGVCIDLKSTVDASFDQFQRKCYNFRYHIQGAYFMDGVFGAVQKEVEQFVIIAIESAAPFGIMVYILDDLMIQSGRVAYNSDLGRVKKCLENPPAVVYQESINAVPMSLPAWAGMDK